MQKTEREICNSINSGHTPQHLAMHSAHTPLRPKTCPVAFLLVQYFLGRWKCMHRALAMVKSLKETVDESSGTLAVNESSGALPVNESS